MKNPVWYEHVAKFTLAVTLIAGMVACGKFHPVDPKDAVGELNPESAGQQVNSDGSPATGTPSAGSPSTGTTPSSSTKATVTGTSRLFIGDKFSAAYQLDFTVTPHGGGTAKKYTTWVQGTEAGSANAQEGDFIYGVQALCETTNCSSYVVLLLVENKKTGEEYTEAVFYRDNASGQLQEVERSSLKFYTARDALNVLQWSGTP